MRDLTRMRASVVYCNTSTDRKMKSAVGSNPKVLAADLSSEIISHMNRLVSESQSV